jgi:hypothetical protein
VLTIYKYPVPVQDEPAVWLPQGARVLTVQTQREIPYIWALVDPKAYTTLRVFRLAGTGQPISETDDLRYIGTFQLHDGQFVFHLFE